QIRTDLRASTTPGGWHYTRVSHASQPTSSDKRAYPASFCGGCKRKVAQKKSYAHKLRKFGNRITWSLRRSAVVEGRDAWIGSPDRARLLRNSPSGSSKTTRSRSPKRSAETALAASGERPMSSAFSNRARRDIFKFEMQIVTAEVKAVAPAGCRLRAGRRL